MSLAKRITILVLLVVTAGITGMSIALYHFYVSAKTHAVDGRNSARLAWLAASIEMVEQDDCSTLEFEAISEPSDIAEFWSIQTKDGRILWSSQKSCPTNNVIRGSHITEFGHSNGVHITGRDLVANTANQQTDADEREHREFSTSPDNQSSANTKANEIEYDFYKNPAYIQLIMNSSTSDAALAKESKMFASFLLIFTPTFIALIGILVVFSVRWSLKPLEKIAEDASNIDPDKLSSRINVAGNSAECARLQISINAMVDRLVGSIKRERSFARSAAHDLRTPLAHLRAGIEINLRHDRNLDTYKTLLNDMLDDIMLLEKMVSGLLQLAQSNQPQLQNCTISASLNNIIDKIIPENATINEIPDIYSVIGEESLLKSAILNIFQNAQRYAPGSPIDVVLSEKLDLIELIIADHGQGIPIDQQENIFDPLVKLDQARTVTKDQGYGLGLAVARNTVRAFGGNLICTNRSDNKPGAQFIFTFKKA